MRTKQRGSGEVMLLIVFIAVMFLGAWAWESASCRAQWENSGMRSSYGLLKHCQVQLPDGRWLPAERLREIDLTKKADK